MIQCCGDDNDTVPSSYVVKTKSGKIVLLTMRSLHSITKDNG